jgi:arylsulfatase A-like enzyme
LCVIDCLRLDRVCAKYMPLLTKFAEENTFFTNYWSVSHCTDPSITAMLTGKHPDTLRLYSMMYGSRWDLPEDVEMISQTARKAGYSTGFITNLGRWYKRGVEFFVDCRNWPSQRIFKCAKAQVTKMQDPWFVIVHTDAMHARYSGGSYDAAASITDNDLADLLSVVDMENTCIIITSDHGEGLGQSGPDGHRIEQHGYGLWNFLTHVPLITNIGGAFSRKSSDKALVDNQSIYDIMRQVVCGVEKPCFIDWDIVFQAGATPKVFHRGAVWHEDAQFTRATTKYRNDRYYTGTVVESSLEAQLAGHCRVHGIDYGKVEDDAIVIERLKALGYWEE